MRCYFIRGGHIADVDKLAEFSDEEAMAKAHALFSERKDLFEGFELWDGARVLRARAYRASGALCPKQPRRLAAS
jgi:hypothetical protein